MMVIAYLDARRNTETEIVLRVVVEILVADGVRETERTLFPCLEGRQVQVATSLLVGTELHREIVRPFAVKRAVPLCPALKVIVVLSERFKIEEVETDTGLSSGGANRSLFVVLLMSPVIAFLVDF
jgi:hypothetical protein